MQPVFASDLLSALALFASVLAWLILEAVVQFQQRRRLRPGPHLQREDKGSRLALEILLRLGVGLCYVLAFVAPSAAIGAARYLLFWLGLLLIMLGITLRFYAIHVLGQYFTTTVVVTSTQTVVDAGPYKHIRHPSYTGLLLIMIGFGLTTGNWLSILVLLLCVLPALAYRIHIEEQALQAHIGPPYLEYMQRTKRLIPFIL